jgi:acyl transferase domain-containing protein/glutamate-1-semialdehyde aminotransferase
MTTLDPGAAADGVAIVGMAGRFPGANDLAAFWRNLVSGVESISRFERHEIEPSGLDAAGLLDDPSYVPARGVLDGVELFDADFFGVNPSEARILDPQQRLFLEAAWEALERAGYDPQAFRGAIGVFAGMSNNSYFAANLQAHCDRSDLAFALQTMMGNEKDYLATRVSYKLDLKGPSISVQTACSTSLVAVCQAVQSLLAYQCDMALAGGVSITLPQRRGYLCYDGGITSSDGHCRAFDASAEGTVFSNGLGIVVLKRMSDAIADRDHIIAVIKGTALNNDGSAKVSFLAPSVDGHAEAVAMAQAFARIDARSISYVEAHGTGTGLGDVVEVAALTQAFRAQTPDTGFCALGSLKTNIGHLDAAAGVAGLIKAALALQHRVIPPTLHFTAPSPKLALETTPFFVNTAPLDWAAGSTPRRAGVSSLGVGGTNAHVVLEEAPPLQPSTMGKGAELLVVSARTATALESATDHLRQYLEQHPTVPLADVAYTLQVGRRRFAHRRALVCRDAADAARALRERPSRRVMTGDLAAGDANIGFLLPCHVKDAAAHGRELYDREPAFHQAIQECSAAVRQHLDLNVPDLLYSKAPARSSARMHTPSEHAALFAVEYALSRLWMHWGIRPTLLVASGVGDFVAAALANVFSLADAAMLMLRRAEMIEARRVDPVRFASLVRAVNRKAPDVELASAATGEWVTARQAVDPEYWGSVVHVPTVAAPIERLALPTPLVLLTAGPAEAGEVLRATRHKPALLTIVPTLRDGRGDIESMLETLGQLWLHGIDVDWARLHDGELRARVPLPTYPFERQRHWMDAVPAPAAEPRAVAAKPAAEAPRAAPAAVGSREDAIARLTVMFSELSGLAESELHPQANFFELGLDSLFLTRAAGAIQKTFRVKVTFRELLEDLNTIEALAGRLEGATVSTPGAAAAPSPARRAESAAASAARKPAEEPRADQPAKAFGPFRPIDKGVGGGLTDQQSRALQDLIARYTAVTPRSKSMTAEHRSHLADPRTVAGFRQIWKEMVYPIVVARAAGSRVWDVDGNEYVDLVHGFGTNLFGHSPQFVTQALEAQLKLGIPIGPQSPLAGIVARLACEMTGHERVAFCNTGSEAVTAAIRTARTVTGRDKIAMFAGAYHGTFDEVLARGSTVRGEPRAVAIAPGIPAGAFENIIVLEYGSPAALDALRAYGPELAAVLVEPVQSRRPELQPIAFLRAARHITAETGTALVFDEVVTGFRAHQGGVQALFGIKPDLATYGKVVGGGLPIGLVAGDATYLDALDGGGWEYGDGSFPVAGMTFFAGTFVRHPLALAAACAVLTHLKNEGPELQRRLNLRTTALVETLNARAAELQVPVSVSHFSSWFCVNFGSDVPFASLFFAYMRQKGIHTWEGRPSFVTTAHTDEDLARVVDAFAETLAEMRRGGFLPARPVAEVPPVPGARRGKRPDGRDAWFLPDPNRPGKYLEVSAS